MYIILRDARGLKNDGCVHCGCKSCVIAVFVVVGVCIQ